MAKRIPTHRDAYTLPQVYHRWRFIDAKYYWWSLSEAERQAYAAAAKPFLLSGWSYFLGLYLQDPIDQVLWLRMDEGSGNLVADASGKGNHGTRVNASWVPGFISNALQCSPANDYVNCPTSDTLNLAPEHKYLTLTFWVRPASLSKSQYYALKNVCYIVWFNLTPPRVVCGFWGSSGYNSMYTVNPLVLDTWQHLAFVYSWDDGYMRLFYQGQQINSKSVGQQTIDTNTQPFRVSYPGASPCADAIFDDVRLYRRACAAQQISDIALKEWYPF